jgi:signal transduction histidine kinase
MKLWQKISLVVFLFTIIITEIILTFITPRIEKEIISLHGEKLKAIAATAAAYIDGDSYTKMDFSSEGISKTPEFIKFRKQLEAVKRNLNLKEELYTVNLTDSDKAIFGIMTNKIPFAGDTLHITSREAMNAYNKVHETIGCSYTGLYMDQYGSWVSGMAPIVDSRNNVVGIVQADHEADTVYAKIDDIKNFILLVQLGSIPFLLLISIFVSKITTNPIAKVIDRIDKISKGDYRRQKKLKATKEVNNLIEATDKLRRTILEQQEKIFASIKELQEKNAELEEAKNIAESSDRLKSEFLAMISHEVRTPLNVILNYLSLIEMDLPEDDDTDAKMFFDSVRSSSDRLVRTIELIITTAQLQTGTYDFTEERVDLRELLIQLQGNSQKYLEGKNVNLIYNIPDTPAIIKGNEFLLYKMFENLIENAVIFTADGDVTISLSKDDTEKIRVSVEDTGQGISEEFQREMFDIFKQEDAGYSRKHDGNGLGLALVKNACEIHSAELSWKSEVGKGTKFTVMFEQTEQMSDNKNHNSPEEVFEGITA